METRTRIAASEEPVLREATARLRALYGDRIKRIVLYGSRARGDHRPDSDYDIAVFLRDYDGSWDETTRMADLSYEFMMAHDWNVSIKLFRLVDWRIDTIFMRHLRRDGIEI